MINNYQHTFFTAAQQAEFWKMVEGLLITVGPFIMIALALVLSRKVIGIIVTTMKKAFSGSSGSSKRDNVDRQQREQRQERNN